MVVYNIVNKESIRRSPMVTSLVRIGEHARIILKELSDETGESARVILDRALEEYRRHRLLEETNRAFARLKKDKKAWMKEIEERKAWDSTLADGRKRRRR